MNLIEKQQQQQQLEHYNNESSEKEEQQNPYLDQAVVISCGLGVDASFDVEFANRSDNNTLRFFFDISVIYNS